MWLGAASQGSAGMALEGKQTKRQCDSKSSLFAWQGEDPVTRPCLQPSAGFSTHTQGWEEGSTPTWAGFRALVSGWLYRGDLCDGLSSSFMSLVPCAWCPRGWVGSVALQRAEPWVCW